MQDKTDRQMKFKVGDQWSPWLVDETELVGECGEDCPRDEDKSVYCAYCTEWFDLMLKGLIRSAHHGD
jgi:hypothetical protein